MLVTRLRALEAALLLACAIAAAAHAGAPPAAHPGVAALAPFCGGAPQHPPRFAAGETYRYKLDLLGADVGTLEISIASAPGVPRGSVLMRSRVRTSAFVTTNLGRYEAFAEALLGPGLAARRYTESSDEGDVHRALTVEFPPRGATLAARGTRNGQPDPLALTATPSARDLLSAWLLLRGVALVPGTPFCSEVYAGKRVWRITGTVAAKETIDTPLGSFATARIDTTATRADDPTVVRNGHFWVSDDTRRLPLVAMSEVRGKTVQAQLVEVLGPNAIAAREPRKTRHEETRAATGSTSIGR